MGGVSSAKIDEEKSWPTVAMARGQVAKSASGFAIGGVKMGVGRGVGVKVVFGFGFVCGARGGSACP
jgi:hypothetical protein